MISSKTKLIAIFVAIVMLISVVGCSQQAAPKDKPGEAKAWQPTKQVTLMAPAGAGGGLDMVARTMAKLFEQEKIVTQPMIVENKPGGGQVTGTVEFATKNAKDDHSLMIASTPFILNHIKKDGNSPIGPEEVYPLALLQEDYGVIAVAADSKYKTLKELYDAVKADPSKVQFCGGGAPGTWDHTNSVLLAVENGVDPKTMKYNTYDGGGEALTALLGGHADALTSDVSSVKQYVQAGRVRVLGVSSEKKLADDAVMKDIPTYKDAGFNVTTSNWRGIFLGKDVSDEAKKYWGEKVKALCESNAWKEELKKQGVIYNYKDAKGFFDLIKSDEAAYTKVFQQLGFAK